MIANGMRCNSVNLRVVFLKNLLFLPLLFVGSFTLQVGCESHTSGVTQTDTKTQIERLFNLYKSYVEVNRKAPPNEKALKDYAKGLSEKQLDEQSIGKDLEAIFVSPRDKEPFQIAYGQMLTSGGEPVAVIYEKTGEKGMKYVALSIGYTEEYDDETLKQYLPKKK